MGATMRLDDATRVNILAALLEPKMVKPNIRQIKRKTGYHKSTIISSLDFMEKQGLIEGFGPRVNFRVLGYKLEAMTLLQIDLSKKDLFQKFLKELEDDPHLYWLSGMLSSSTYNVIARHIYKDIESYQKHTQEDYFEKIPGIYDLIRDRQVLFSTEPVFKSSSRTRSVVEIIKREKGYK